MITINLNKAREIHKSYIRTARQSKLHELDIQFQRALETGDSTAEIVTNKTLLRDAPQNPQIEQASTLDELKSTWDAGLLGPSPYV